MTTSTPTLMERLKQETWPLHQQAEHAELEQDLIKGRLPREAYRDYLAQRYLIHRVLDQRLREARYADPRVAAVVDDNHFHEPRAAEDLRFFGGDPERAVALPATEQLLRAIDDAGTLSLLGFQYVFEGSTNGARFIARALRAAWNLAGEEGTRYLDPYGEAQRERWTTFRAAMDALPCSAEECDAIVAAAQATFRQIIDVEAQLYSLGSRPA